MFKGFQWGGGLLAVAIVFAVGCAAKTHDAVVQTDPNGVAKMNAKPPVSAEAAVQAVLDGLKASKPVVVWDTLEPSLQNLLNDCVRALAGEVDPEVWDATAGNFKKLVHVLETKKDFLLDSPLWAAAGLKRADLKASWGPSVAMLKTISQSELVDRARMTKFDGGRFLAGTGAVLYKEAHELFRSTGNDWLKEIENLKVTVRESHDQNATLVLQSSERKTKSIELVLFAARGKWSSMLLSVVGKSLADRISSYQKLFKVYYVADWKDEYLADMARLGKGLDGLEAAKTSDAFQAVVGRDIFPLLLRRIAQFRKGVPKYHGLKAVSYQRRASTALVVVKGKHAADEPAMIALTVGFNRMVPAPEKVSFPRVVDGKTAVLVAPVEDINVLAHSVKGGKVVNVDARRKTLTVEVPDVAGSGKGSAPKNASAKSVSAER